MSSPESSDFPVTRRNLERLDEWLMALASPLLPLKSVRVDLQHMTGVMWEFTEQNERSLLVGKAVRMVTGIRAALILADLGYISECGTILRTVSDFANEIISICEGCRRKALTNPQKRFIEQYFRPLAKDPDEYDSQAREKWVTRDELLTPHWQWAMEGKGDPLRARKVLRYLAHMYDKFVHAYITAVELYDGRTHRFMLRGHESPERKEEYKRATASKCYMRL